MLITLCTNSLKIWFSLFDRPQFTKGSFRCDCLQIAEHLTYHTYTYKFSLISWQFCMPCHVVVHATYLFIFSVTLDKWGQAENNNKYAELVAVCRVKWNHDRVSWNASCLCGLKLSTYILYVLASHIRGLMSSSSSSSSSLSSSSSSSSSSVNHHNHLLLLLLSLSSSSSSLLSLSLLLLL